MIEPFVIAVPIYNALGYVQKMLTGLDQYYPDRHLILVDDCSGTETADFIGSYSQGKPKTQLIRRPKRGLFTRAMNTGLAAALATEEPWIVTLNSDTEIGPGCFEEMFECWNLAYEHYKKPVGLVGCEGPRDQTHKRWLNKPEPAYVTGHAVLLKKEVLRHENLRFPQDNNEVRGFSAQDLIHIASDRALSWEFTRRGYLTVASYWAALGHVGGASWKYNWAELGRDARTLD